MKLLKLIFMSNVLFICSLGVQSTDTETGDTDSSLQSTTVVTTLKLSRLSKWWSYTE